MSTRKPFTIDGTNRDQSIRSTDSTSVESIPWDSTWSAPAQEGDRRRIVSYMEERFGISAEVFSGYVWFRRRHVVRILKASPHLVSAARLRVEAVGMKAFYFIGDFIKPSTRIIQVFGPYATRCRMDLDREDLEQLVRGREIPADERVENGYMILCHQGDPLGLGLLLNGRLRSQIPKSEARFFQSGIHESNR